MKILSPLHPFGIIVVSLCCALQVSCLTAQEGANEIVTKLAEVCRKHNVPGMAVAAVNADEVLQVQCFGVRKRGSDDKIALLDRFPIGSNTKSMTATLSAVLVEAGKIDWGTTLSEVWPEGGKIKIHPQLRKVTLEQLLSHQSGLPANVSDISEDTWNSFFPEEQAPKLERRRLLEQVLSHAPPHEHGKFLYSNLGYVIASAMLETRANDSFESLMKKHVFGPLKMQTAEFRTLENARRMRPPFLWGHRADGGEPVDPRTAGAENPTVYAAAGTVHVSLSDYAKYARWHLSGKPAPVLQSQETFDRLHKPLVDYSLPGARYGLGWICLETANGPALQHAGSNTQSFALMWIVPQTNVAAIACTNTGEGSAFPACDEMVGFLMQKYASEKTQAKSKVEKEVAKVAPERLEGRYRLTPNFIFDVKCKDGRLFVGITNQPTQEVFAETPTRWAYRGVAAKLEFQLKEEGPAQSLTLLQNGIAQKAARIQE
jgi:CubicO group peptidase (beta-lactamase class C family)